MTKSLKKYKRPLRAEKESVREAETAPVEQMAMLTLAVPPAAAEVKKKRQRQRKRRVPDEQKIEMSEDESQGRIDSGNESSAFTLQLPSAAIPPEEGGADPATPTYSAIDEPVEDEGPAIPPATQEFMIKWLPKWHDYCVQFPQPEDFDGVAPYCSAGMDLILAFTRDVTASHISKKGLPFDVSPPHASPWEVEFNNVFYPADKIRNFIDINVRRFEKFREGEEMEGRMWVDMDVKYRNNVDALLEKVVRFKGVGAWEKESRRVNEMVRYGVFGKVEAEDECKLEA